MIERLRTRKTSLEGRNIPEEIPRVIRDHILPKKVLTIVGLSDADTSSASRLIHTSLFARETPRQDRLMCVSKKKSWLVSGLTVFQNIFFDKPQIFKSQKNALLAEFNAAADLLKISLDPDARVSSLTEEERITVEIIKALLVRPDYIFLYSVVSMLGLRYIEVFHRALKILQEKGCCCVYFTTKWEETLSIGNFYAVVYRGKLLDHIFYEDELASNPRRLVYLLSGLNDDNERVVDKESIDMFTSLYQNSQLFTNSYDLDQTFKRMVETINDILRAEACVMYLYGGDGRFQRYHSAMAASEPYVIKDESVQYLVQEGKAPAYIVSDGAEYRHLFVNPVSDTRTVFCLPIRCESKIACLLQIVFPNVHVCDQNETLIINTFHNEISIMIDAANLINQSTLLRESHHRIKNNLQIIIGILYSQKSFLRANQNEADFMAMIDSLVGRIKSISLVHDLLSRGEYGSDSVPLTALINEIMRLYQGQDILFKTDLDSLSIVCGKATSIAMILNELISNCYRHAFTKWQEKIISIRCEISGGSLIIEIADNGGGLPDGVNAAVAQSVGMTVVNSLLAGLGGRISYHNDAGAHAVVEIPRRAISAGESEY